MDPSVDEAALALGCWFWGCVGGSKWDSLYSLLFFFLNTVKSFL